MAPLPPVRGDRAIRRLSALDSTKSPTTKLLVLIAVAAPLTLLAVTGTPDVGAIRSWTGSGGVAGPAAFVVLFAVGSALLWPKSMMSIAAGAIFTLPVAIAVAALGATLGAALSFALIRVLGPGAIASRVPFTTIRRLDASLAEHGFVGTLVLRLLPPVPFAVVNYGAGLTAVRAGPFLAGTALGVGPASAVYASIGGSAALLGGTFPWILASAVIVLAVAAPAMRLARMRARRGCQGGVESVADCAAGSTIPTGDDAASVAPNRLRTDWTVT